MAEVEVDVETGEVRIFAYVAMQDSGRLINPMIVEGQVHGGIVHGIGNALFEWMGYDETGQPVTTTFADYLLPTATELPRLEALYRESAVPAQSARRERASAKSAPFPAAAAIAAAVEDALRRSTSTSRKCRSRRTRLVELIRKARGRIKRCDRISF